MVTSFNVLACKPLGLELELPFEKGIATLSASNIKKLADWQIRLADNFNDKGTYLGELKTAPSLNVPPVLAEQREQHIRHLLGQLGVPQDRIQTRTVPLKSPRSERANVVGLGFEPDCPNPCCPSSEPVNKP
jgi:hypothetical protein